MQEGVLDWCSRWGLLGILHTKTVGARFAARWSEINNHKRAVQYCLTRVNGWFHDTVASVEFDCPPQNFVSDGVVPLNQCRDFALTPPCIFVQRNNEHGVEIFPETLEKAWGEFFPAIPREEESAADYFDPHREEFWWEYGEPVREFVRYALLFRRAMDELRAPSIPGFRPTMDYFYAALGHEFFASEAGSLETRYQFASLVSLLAKMACQDLQGGFSEHQCAGCGIPFMSDAYNAKYCCQACEWKGSKRRKRLKADSISVEESRREE